MAARILVPLLFALPVAALDSAACAGCHRAIYDSYRLTPMATSSGPVGRAAPMETFADATFTHSASGFRYQVRQSGGRYFVEFEKTADRGFRGSRELTWFIGSGAVARSYLTVADGFVYQAPVSYYSARSRWQLAPGYDQYAYPYLTRPATASCLGCHASLLQLVEGTQNRYRTPPFREGGITCERCHGAGEEHIKTMKSIVNPARLAPDRRDSICAQCHLSGAVRVMRAGSRPYRPGDRLSDSMTVFVRSGASRAMTVTSHVEDLARSACKRASGDRLWCGACHDAHSMPKPAGRAAWFRRKCLGCHAADACEPAKTRDDCTGCHMPKNPVADAQHVVFTDHSIPRRPRPPGARPEPDAELAPFGGDPASPRDLGLAYAIAGQPARALKLLEEAAKNSPEDVEVLLYLGEIYRNSGRDELAIPLYRRAMRLDPAQVTASVGLGAILFQRGEYSEAIRCWQDALSKNAGLELVRTNLAMAQWRAGDLKSAEATLQKAVELSPGFKPARDLLQRLRQR